MRLSLHFSTRMAASSANRQAAAVESGRMWRASSDSPAPRRVRYSGAITAESPRGELISAIKIRIYGFRQVKVKVGTNGQDDAHRLARLRRILGRRMDVRLDANEAWSAAELVERVRPLLPFEPDGARAAGCSCRGRPSQAELRSRLGIPVMLDESLCGYPDARAAVEHQTADLLNVRLSKCGGIIPSLRIIALARRFGLGVQLGCHPGETSLLSAAGRHVACRVSGLRFVEGSFDRHILAANLTPRDRDVRVWRMGQAPRWSRAWAWTSMRRLSKR